MRFKEILATLSVVVSLVAIPVSIGWYHNNYVLGAYPETDKVITLWAVAKDGAWTLDKVDGTNYWWKDFKPATIYLEEGDKVVLRFESTDVHHRFYCPELNIGPMEVEPGHVMTTEFKAKKAGTYRYYCTSMCGELHFYMQGLIVVTSKGQSPQQPEQDVTVRQPHYDKPSEDDMVAWGRYLYQKNGCITCHGDEGEGGIENPNYAKEGDIDDPSYVKGSVPAHNTIAESFFLEEKEDAETFVEWLIDKQKEPNIPPPDIPRSYIVLKKYEDAIALIHEGKNCAKADPNGPEPPLQMPSWEALLTDRDIDAIIAYIITLYEWEEEEEWEEDEE